MLMQKCIVLLGLLVEEEYRGLCHYLTIKNKLMPNLLVVVEKRGAVGNNYYKKTTKF
jgi:hypothetical protein